MPQGWGVLWRQRRCACAVILATPVLCKEQEELHSCVEEAIAGGEPRRVCVARRGAMWPI